MSNTPATGAAGKVCTGFSRPYVAKYNNAGGTVTYSDGMRLARGVSVSIDATAGDDNTFYADNAAAETAPGTFTSGTVTLTVDGLHTAARRLVLGLPQPVTVNVGEETVNVTDYDDEMAPPYMGLGFLVRYMSGGVTTWAPVVLTKTRFSDLGIEAETQEEEINWQTQELTAALMRDDTPKHRWKRIADDQPTEEQADAVLRALLNIIEEEG